MKEIESMGHLGSKQLLCLSLRVAGDRSMNHFPKDFGCNLKGFDQDQLQTYLRNVAGPVPDHGNKAKLTIK